MSLFKSKERVADHGEVFTPAWMVEAMLDLVQGETKRIDSRFLEPACGSGNFLVRIALLGLPRLKARRAPSPKPANHALMRHGASAVLNLVPTAIELRDCVIVHGDGVCLQHREFRNEFGDRHAEFCRTCLQHVRSLFIHFDPDVGAHTTRIT